MRRWVCLACVFALLIVLKAAPPVGSDVTDIWIEITDYEQNPAQGSVFPVSFTVHVPADVTIPSSTPTHSSFLYYSTFYFDQSNNIWYPAEGYWWSPNGSANYSSAQTQYTFQVKMATGTKVESTYAPAGQKFYLGIYWTISLESSWTPSTGDYQSLVVGDNVTFRIYGDNTTYTKSIVSVDSYPDYKKYTISDTSAGDIYVRSDKAGMLYIRALKSNLTVIAAPSMDTTMLIVAGGVALAVVVGIILFIKRRGRGELSESEAPRPPSPFEAPPASPPGAPPEAPPAPPKTPDVPGFTLPRTRSIF